MSWTRKLLLLSPLLLSACQPQVTEEQALKAPFDIVETTIADIQSAIRTGQTSCRSVVAAYLARIDAYDEAGGINAITVTNPRALERADALDALVRDGSELPTLFCAPILVKDNFDTVDMVTTAGSMALKDSLPPDDAYMVRVLREAGAIVIAKTNMGEWAFSPRETVSSSFGRTANAYDTDFTPAGSSGGTASGVAANLGVAGLGSDTGNSIRGPSSHLALFGIRSTLGLTSRDGVVPLIFDRDVAGPIARTVEDGVRLFDVVAGHDPTDPLSVPDRREADYTRFLKADGLEGKRIGVLRRLVDHEDADPEILELFNAALEELEAAGATVIDSVAIDEFDTLTEAIGFCGRFRHDLRVYLETLESPPFLDMKTLFDNGDFAPESTEAMEWFSGFPFDVRPDDWETPCRTWPNDPNRNLLQANTVAAMDVLSLDALAYPSWSNPPAPIDDAVAQYKGDNSQLLVPDAGLPAVTVPMGFWQGRLPAGLQFAGRPFAEGTLIEIAYAYEQRTQHRRPPAGFGALDAEE